MLKKDNNIVVALLMLYGKKTATIIKVKRSIIYFIMDNYVCVDYLCFLEGLLLLEYKVFENTTFNYISRTGIPEVLFNIMSCNDFSKEDIETVILMCSRKSVPYYL